MAGSTAAPRQRELLFSVALFAVALLPRLFVAIAWAREPVWDGHYYHFGAERIAQGFGYSEDVVVAGQTVAKPWCHYPVGYSALLSAFYWVFGAKLWVAPALNALIGSSTVVLVHRLGLRFLSPLRARVAGTIAALHPGLIVATVLVMTEGLTALLILAAPLAVLWRGRSLRASALGGLLVGLATLVRPSSLLAAPALALLYRRGKTAWAAGAIASAVAVAVVVPWSLRNCAVMDGCAFVSTNGGWNLAIGALTQSGRFSTLRASDGCPVVTGQVQQDRCWARVGRETIFAEPVRWLRLIPKKLGHTYDHESFAIEYLREANPEAWPQERRVAGRGLLTLFHRILVAAAGFSVVAWAFRLERRKWHAQLALGLFVLGLVLYGAFHIQHPFFVLAAVLPVLALLPVPGRPRHGAGGRYALALVFATTLTHAIFFGDDRYHLVISPVLCLLAAAALRPPAERR